MTAGGQENILSRNVKSILYRYGQCLKLLEEMKDNLLLDIYLAPHINTLFSMIRNRGLVQYFSPYSSADLHKMANSFNTSVSSLENELMKLILDGSIQVIPHVVMTPSNTICLC